jgi:abortive infection bacteriophage resistance protein
MQGKPSYSKLPLTIEQQIELLKKRGMSFKDEDKAKAVLKRIQYARLRLYWHPFELDQIEHNFQVGTTFEQVLHLYEFDRKLRLFILEAIERIEVVLRTQWAYQMAMKYGPFGYLQKNVYRDSERYARDFNRLQEEWKRSRDEDPVFLNFQVKYQESLPPVWLACEVMSFGTLSRWFSNLGDDEVSKAIAALFGLPHSYLKGATRHLVAVRNYAAHHARVWDRVFSVNTLPELREKPPELRKSLEPNPHPQKIYRTLTLLMYLMPRLVPDSNWGAELKKLLSQQTHLQRMGFPVDYQSRPVWQP